MAVFAFQIPYHLNVAAAAGFVVALLQRFVSLRREPRAQEESLGTMKYSHVISRAEKYVAENFCDPNISLLSVARYVGLSAAHFSTVFSQTVGRSFINYLTAMRIERAKELLRIFDLEEERNNLACNLPYGKQRKLEIARALATNPKLLLLDEPAAGMNPHETEDLAKTIRFIRDNFDMTILLIEHDMKFVAGLCDEVTVLNFGTVLAEGDTKTALNDPEVIKAYIGG